VKARPAVLAWFLRVVVVVAVALVWFVDPLSTQQGDTATIDRYDATYDLSADGTLFSTETLDVSMPAGKHGIFRIFDTRDERRNGLEHAVSDVTVVRDGASEPYEWVDGPAGTKTLRIGSAGVTLTPGVHRYVITSRTTDTLERGPDGTVRWWWNVVGTGWQMPMGAVAVEVDLPAEVSKVECVEGSDTSCRVDTSERTLTVETGPLDPYTPVTLRATFPEGSLAEPPPDPADNKVLWSLVAAAVGLALGAYFIAATREKTPGFPVLFEPPTGVSPALGAKVLHETDSDDDLQAMLYDLGSDGVVRLDGNDYSWNVNLLVDASDPRVGDLERSVLASLGLTAAGQSFLVAKDPDSGEQIAAARSTLRHMVATQATSYLAPSTPGILGSLLGWLAVLGVVGLAGLHLFGQGRWLGWPLFFGLAAFALVAATVAGDGGRRTKRTEHGRDLWSRTGGFARFLTTDSAESRFEAAKHMDWYPAYLAWALVFGSADAWARRFESQGVAVPSVPWIYWTGTGHAGSNFASGMAASFDSAVSSATASYTASQASSGSSSFGGGGFSGGSGGGGGGGGSW